MSFTKLSDVKGHLHPPFLTKTHFGQPESQPDATGFSGADPDTIKVNRSGNAEDFVAEHSSSLTALAQGDPVIGSIDPQAATTSKNVQS